MYLDAYGGVFPPIMLWTNAVHGNGEPRQQLAATGGQTVLVVQTKNPVARKALAIMAYGDREHGLHFQDERKNMKISQVGITRGDLRAEPNGSDFNVSIGGTSRVACPKEEAIEFFETKTTADQKADKDAVIDWLKKQP